MGSSYVSKGWNREIVDVVGGTIDKADQKFPRAARDLIFPKTKGSPTFNHLNLRYIATILSVKCTNLT